MDTVYGVRVIRSNGTEAKKADVPPELLEQLDKVRTFPFDNDKDSNILAPKGMYLSIRITIQDSLFGRCHKIPYPDGCYVEVIDHLTLSESGYRMEEMTEIYVVARDMWSAKIMFEATVASTSYIKDQVATLVNTLKGAVLGSGLKTDTVWDRFLIIWTCLRWILPRR